MKNAVLRAINVLYVPGINNILTVLRNEITKPRADLVAFLSLSSVWGN